MTSPMQECNRVFELARGVPRQGRLRLELELNRILRATLVGGGPVSKSLRVVDVQLVHDERVVTIEGDR